MKGIIENLFYELKIFDVDFDKSDIKFLHKYRQAKIFVDGKYIGYLGEYFDEAQEIKPRIYLAVLELENIYEREFCKVKFKELNKFPEIERDLALLVNKNMTAKEIYNIILEFKQKNKVGILKKIDLFDVYEGKNLDGNLESMGYKLIFRASDRTLKDEEINLIMENMISFLKEKYDINLRV